jgi:hypothetical protein
MLKTTIKRSIALARGSSQPKTGIYLIDIYDVFVWGIAQEIILKGTIPAKKSA